LFREQDFRDPGASALLRELWQMPDPTVRALAGHVALAARAPIAAAPLLSELLDPAGGKEPSLAPEQEQAVRDLLGEPGVTVRKPKTGAVVAKVAAPVAAPADLSVIPLVPEAAVTVKPVTVLPVAPRRRRKQ